MKENQDKEIEKMFDDLLDEIINESEVNDLPEMLEEKR